MSRRQTFQQQCKVTDIHPGTSPQPFRPSSNASWTWMLFTMRYGQEHLSCNLCFTSACRSALGRHLAESPACLVPRTSVNLDIFGQSLRRACLELLSPQQSNVISLIQRLPPPPLSSSHVQVGRRLLDEPSSEGSCDHHNNNVLGFAQQPWLSVTSI